MDDLDDMRCQELVLHPGDVLYLPSGIVHFAETDDTSGSVHATYRLLQGDNSWLNRLVNACLQVSSRNSCSLLRSQIRANPMNFAWERPYHSDQALPMAPSTFGSISPSSYGDEAIDALVLAKLMVEVEQPTVVTRAVRNRFYLWQGLAK